MWFQIHLGNFRPQFLRTELKNTVFQMDKKLTVQNSAKLYNSELIQRKDSCKTSVVARVY